MEVGQQQQPSGVKTRPETPTRSVSPVRGRPRTSVEVGQQQQPSGVKTRPETAGNQQQQQSSINMPVGTRGNCSKCGQIVTTEHLRAKDHDGSYYHVDCSAAQLFEKVSTVLRPTQQTSTAPGTPVRSTVRGTRRRGDEATNSGEGSKALLSPSSPSSVLSASRGKCGKCGHPVTTDQLRDKLPNGTYVHVDCASHSGEGFKALLSPSSSSSMLSASRGKCGKCGHPVTTDQLRDKLPNGTYVHVDCASHSGEGFKALLSPSSSSSMLSASRGKCGKCGHPVTTDQLRDKLPNGTYVHVDCASHMREPPRAGLQRDKEEKPHDEVPTRRRGDAANTDDTRSRTLSPTGRSRTLSPVSARARMEEQAKGARTWGRDAGDADSSRRPRTRSPIRDLSASQVEDENIRIRRQIAHLEQLKVALVASERASAERKRASAEGASAQRASAERDPPPLLSPNLPMQGEGRNSFDHNVPGPMHTSAEELDAVIQRETAVLLEAMHTLRGLVLSMDPTPSRTPRELSMEQRKSKMLAIVQNSTARLKVFSSCSVTSDKRAMLDKELQRIPALSTVLAAVAASSSSTSEDDHSSARDSDTSSVASRQSSAPQTSLSSLGMTNGSPMRRQEGRDFSAAGAGSNVYMEMINSQSAKERASVSSVFADRTGNPQTGSWWNPYRSDTDKASSLNSTAFQGSAASSAMTQAAAAQKEIALTHQSWLTSVRGRSPVRSGRETDSVPAAAATATDLAAPATTPPTAAASVTATPTAAAPATTTPTASQERRGIGGWLRSLSPVRDRSPTLRPSISSQIGEQLEFLQRSLEAKLSPSSPPIYYKD